MMIMEAGRKAAKPPLEAFPEKILPHRTQRAVHWL